MKRIIMGLIALTSVSAFADNGAFVFKGKPLKDNSKQAIRFFNEMKSAELSGKKVDICYVGDWTVAQDAFTDTLSFSILSVSKEKALNVEVYNVVDDKSAHGIIPACKKRYNF